MINTEQYLTLVNKINNIDINIDDLYIDRLNKLNRELSKNNQDLQKILNNITDFNDIIKVLNILPKNESKSKLLLYILINLQEG